MAKCTLDVKLHQEEEEEEKEEEEEEEEEEEKEEKEEEKEKKRKQPQVKFVPMISVEVKRTDVSGQSAKLSRLLTSTLNIYHSLFSSMLTIDKPPMNSYRLEHRDMTREKRNLEVEKTS
ncbi:hypothetical protein TREES_T100001565 [Tupaia chinensis]|uniref:Uncharacterized protein n=1 Tax=Tupaia chinensis TaxID=246437 RepID=L9KT22_TUPCH|nr:hypothetical protein TREES_T100001565 [Tupaia chinensis]